MSSRSAACLVGADLSRVQTLRRLILKWLALALFAYVITLAVVKVPWAEALRGLLVPSVKWIGAFLTTLVAILGTTISPYLFIWQSSQNRRAGYRFRQEAAESSSLNEE